MSRRTTLTLDDDVAAKLATEARRSGRPVKHVVNEALRAGLEASAARQRPGYQVQAADLGRRKGVEFDDVWGLIDRLDAATG